MVKKLILSTLKNLGFVPRKWVIGNIREKEYKVINNTIRIKSDKDDAWLFALSRNCKYVFDIGSNIGQAAMLMLYHPGIKKLILVDPNPAALSLAAENMIHNNHSLRVDFVNAFISDKCDESIDFYTQDSGAAGSRYKGFAKTAARQNSHYMVNTLTVDFLVNHFQVVPDLIKVDVEGAEREVLEGCKELAAKGHTFFFVEIHSGPELSIADNTNSILNWSKQNNYSAWYLRDKSSLTVESIKGRGRYHALLTPNGLAFPEILRDIKESDPLK